VSNPRHQLAQVNIALLKAPIDTPLLANFVALLAPINALADSSPGFVWRLQTEDGDSTAIRAFGDDRIIVNMSVWESVEALAAFVYRSRHVEVMRRRRQWFHRVGDAYICLWWIPAGHIPTIEEAEERMSRLRLHGPSPRAFTFQRTFDPHGRAMGSGQRNDEPWLCPSG
jgi:hypothetical protein